MPSENTFNVTLTDEMADAVKAKVATGEYATESEVIHDSLRAFFGRDRAVNEWLVEQVAPAYDALKKDPSRAVRVEELRTRLSDEHKAAIAKK